MPGWVMTMSGLPGAWDMEPPTAKAVVAKLMGVPAVEVWEVSSVAASTSEESGPVGPVEPFIYAQH